MMANLDVTNSYMTNYKLLKSKDGGGGISKEESSTWLIIVDRVQLVICIIGAIVNIMTVITLHKGGYGFQSCVSKRDEESSPLTHDQHR